MKASLPYKYITAVKNGKQYVVFDYKDSEGKRKRKWVTTGLSEKCTKKALKEAVDEIVEEFDVQFRTGELGKPKKSQSVPVSAVREPYAVMGETPESKMTMGEYVDEWLTAIRPNLARTTYQTYKNANKRFVEYLDIHYPNITLGELRHNHVQEFLNHKLNEGCKGSCAKQYYLSIHSCLAYAVKMEYVTVHPMNKLVVPRADKYESAFYNKYELNQLFEVFKGDRIELVVHIAAYYGLRRSEVLGLRWDAVDFTNKTISIQRKVVSDYDENGHRKLFVETRLKTNSTRRTLPLIPHIEKMLLEKKELEAHFKKVCGKSYDTEFEGFICRDNFGKLLSPEYVTGRFHYVITKHGLKHLRFHDLRHSCASLLLANDVPMKAIQEWLGHSNYSITANLYSHLEYNAKVISAETIARVLDGEAEQQGNTSAENTKPAPVKKSAKKSASDKSTAKTTDTSASKKSGGRKKNSETSNDTDESQTSRL
ncbi:MAG: site-specific integrase [Oscillospiraceae bacterium]|nr:site-specific integrase [Oscillospiraceae bacterium]